MSEQSQENRKVSLEKLKAFIEDPAGLMRNDGLRTHVSFPYIQRAFGAAYGLIENVEGPIREKYIKKIKEAIDKNAKGVFVMPTREGIQSQFYYEPVSKWNETSEELGKVNKEKDAEMSTAYKQEVELEFEMIPDGKLPPFQMFPKEKQAPYIGILIPEKKSEGFSADTTNEKESSEALENSKSPLHKVE